MYVWLMVDVDDLNRETTVHASLDSCLAEVEDWAGVAVTPTLISDTLVEYRTPENTFRAERKRVHH